MTEAMILVSVLIMIAATALVVKLCDRKARIELPDEPQGTRPKIQIEVMCKDGIFRTYDADTYDIRGGALYIGRRTGFHLSVGVTYDWDLIIAPGEWLGVRPLRLP